MPSSGDYEGYVPLPAYRVGRLLAMATATIDYGPDGVRVVYGDGRMAVYLDRDEMYGAMEARVWEWAVAAGLAPIVVSTHRDTVEVDEGICVEEVTLYTITVGAKASPATGSIYVLALDMKAETRGCRTQRTLTPLQVTVERRPLPDPALTPRAYRAMRRIEWDGLDPGVAGEARSMLEALAVHELYGEEAGYIASLRRHAHLSRAHSLVARALPARPP